MITAIDFGCDAIRSAFRSMENRRQISLFSERAQYTVLPNTHTHLQALADNHISYATCEDSLVVFGNQAASVRWLSKTPSAPLFTDGSVPREDAPARQILSILTRALLPAVDTVGYCFYTGPGGTAEDDNKEFLSRLIRMHGWIPIQGSPGNAVILASGSENRFTGISVIVGAESTRIAIARFGQELSSETLNVGSNWIDNELASQHEMKTWAPSGDCYLDLEAVRDWKHDPSVNLRSAGNERERTLGRLYDVVLGRIARSIREQLGSMAVDSVLAGERLSVACAGGAALINGFIPALTDRLVEHDIAGRITTLRVVEDAETCVVRGLMIQGELEQLTATRAA
ncbi:MAG: hypothetical protein NXI04_18605 [Planctomycetaceae bacterium]|nr:hypothetical protein [Planctomycetaceae bacterium]